MEERRKSMRMGLESTIIVKRIDDGRSENVTIEIQDISKTGVGFLCREELEMGAIYESHITIWTKEVIHTLLKIVREGKHGDGYQYGAQFMGLSEIDAFRISVYEALIQAQQKEDTVEQEKK